MTISDQLKYIRSVLAGTLWLLTAIWISGCSSLNLNYEYEIPKELLEQYPNSKVLRSDYSERIEAVLEKAGENRKELVAVINHFADCKNPLKRKAAEFLIANMGSHSYVKVSYVDADGSLIPYDSLKFETFEKARDALASLEKKHPGMESKVEVVKDVKVMKSEYLIDDIDLAFEVWQTREWAKDVTFDTFCNYILPYRGSNEPINSWRKICLENVEKELAKLDKSDPKALEKAIQKVRKKWLRFQTKAYLHPTDQGFDEMLESGIGRCEDISNMVIYISRSIGRPMTSDYTPAWPKGDNNHAWNSPLDGNGKALKQCKFGHVAKIYRKGYAERLDLPCFNTKEGEVIPNWVRGACFQDVTAEQHKNTATITVPIKEDIPPACSWIYLAVFNRGRWVPLAAAPINSGKDATFKDLGWNIMYRPVFCIADGKKKKLISAAPILILEKGGNVRFLKGQIKEEEEKVTVKIIQTKDVQINPDTGKPMRTVKVEPDREYEMFYFDGDWKSLGKKTSTESELIYDNLPAGRLYRLRELKGQNKERPFTVENGKPVLW